LSNFSIPFSAAETHHDDGDVEARVPGDIDPNRYRDLPVLDDWLLLVHHCYIHIFAECCVALPC
jgi:hypothetical protein